MGKKRRSRSGRDHGFEYDGDSEGGKLLNAHFGHGDPDADPVDFCDLLVDWQLQMKHAKPIEMLVHLGLDTAGVTEQDWMDMELGTAVPDLVLIEPLREMYEMERGDEAPSASAFANAGRRAWSDARLHKLNRDGREVRIVSVPPGALEKISFHTPPVISIEDEDDTPLTDEAEEERVALPESNAPESPRESPFYNHLVARLREQHPHSNLPATVELRALAMRHNLHPWMLQGYMPLPEGKDKSQLIVELARDLYGADTVSAPNGREKALAFSREADAFFTPSTRLDIAGGQHNGFELEFSDLLMFLIEHHKMSHAQFLSALQQNGFRTSESTLQKWLHDPLSHPSTQAVMAMRQVFRLDSQAALDLMAAAEIATYRTRVNYRLGQAIGEMAGTDQFTCANLCKVIVDYGHVSPEEVSYRVGFYPSALQAFASGEVIPSPDAMRRLCHYFGEDAYAGSIMRHASQELDAEPDLAKKTLSLALAAASPETRSAPMFKILKEEGSPFHEAISHSHKSAMDNLTSGIRTNVTAQHIHNLQERMGIQDKPYTAALFEEACHISRGRPFGLMLEDYLANGGKSLAGFMRRFMSADDGWNVSENELCGQLDIDRSSFQKALQRDAIEFDRLIQKFTKGFHLEVSGKLMSRQERLFWYLARGDKTLPSEAVIVLEGQARLRKGEPADVVSHETAIKLWDRSGLTRDRLIQYAGSKRPVLYMHTKPYTSLADPHHSPEVVDRLADGLITSDRHMVRTAANVFAGIADEKTPLELLNEARANKRTPGSILLVTRNQRRQSQTQFALSMPYRDSEDKSFPISTLGGWETDKVNVSDKHKDHADALAAGLGFTGNDADDFAAMMLGHYVSREERRTPLDLLNEARAGRLDFAGFINELMRQRGESQRQLAITLGTTQGSVSHWARGMLVRSAETARDAAQRLGFRDADEEDFIQLAQSGHIGHGGDATSDHMGAHGTNGETPGSVVENAKSAARQQINGSVKSPPS